MDPVEELLSERNHEREGFYVYKAGVLAAERFRLFTKKMQYERDDWTLADTLNLASRLLLAPGGFSPGVKALEVAFNTFLAEHPGLQAPKNPSPVEQIFGYGLRRFAITEAEDRELRERLTKKRGGPGEARPADGEFRAPARAGD